MGQVRGGDPRLEPPRRAHLARNLRHRRGGRQGLRPIGLLDARRQRRPQLPRGCPHLRPGTRLLLFIFLEATTAAAAAATRWEERQGRDRVRVPGRRGAAGDAQEPRRGEEVANIHMRHACMTQ
ncbi:hypothetical protein PR202_ga16744 [Eleusine coracana subsp. coracana]|uniref:Uncharacterized protein n=1 Tax=Eleusine coracana subsp. coracana TaxID=191504 RepID=A0AAV5CNM7_ELECO|nr:hypothetical protein PR202_ga16744 [Eleusine coracana subsp. coracana]